MYKRIIPCLDTKEGRVVKGVKFVNFRDAADPVAAARAYSEAGADELVFLDITASVERRKTVIDLVRKVAGAASIPFAVGGGIRSVEEMEQLLNSGCHKVSINTAAVENPELIRQASQRIGSQRLVVAIDAKKISDDPPRWELYTHGGHNPTGQDALDWAKQVALLGAGELLPTSIDCDGTTDGYDIELTRAIVEATGLPVIASGGAGELEHFYEVLTEGKADAALAASVFHFGTFTIRQVKQYLAERGVEVNL